MGSPVSPAVADLVMEDFKSEALSTAPHPPHVWFRYVDDTFTILHQLCINEFTDHINSINPHIKFTREEEEDNQIPFLDVMVVKEDDGSLRTKVYRKSTHTDQYLNWDSNHLLDHKTSVARTLLQRAEDIVSDPKEKKEEIRHIKEVLTINGYKPWAITIPKKNKTAKKDEKERTTSSNSFPIGIPYIPGLTEKLVRIFKRNGVNTYTKPTNTIRQYLVKPKDKTPKEDQCGVIYEITCNTCQEQYVGETKRQFKIRFKEHTDMKHPNSAITEHIQETGHTFDIDNTKILGKEEGKTRRQILEALKIHQRNPALNNNRGREVPRALLQLLQPRCDTHTTTSEEAM